MLLVLRLLFYSYLCRVDSLAAVVGLEYVKSLETQYKYYP